MHYIVLDQMPFCFNKVPCALFCIYQGIVFMNEHPWVLKCKLRNYLEK